MQGLHRHVYRAPEAGDSNAGAAAPAAAPAPADGGAAAVPAAAPAAAAAPTPAAGALAAGAAPASAPAAAAPPAAPAAPDPVWGLIPEKFRVKNADGSADLGASWNKVEDHRANLERRLGSGDIPPKAATDYTTNVPEAFKDAIKADDLNASPKFTEFRDAMHKAGLSQGQFDAAVGKMLDYSVSLQQGTAKLNETDCITALKADWKDDATYQANIQAAYRGAAAYGDIGKLLAKYNNDPDFIRFAANVGKEVSEDRSAGANAVQQFSGADIDALAKSPAYFNPNDPQHAQVKAKVTAYYDRKYGTAPKSSSSLSIGTV